MQNIKNNYRNPIITWSMCLQFRENRSRLWLRSRYSATDVQSSQTTTSNIAILTKPRSWNIFLNSTEDVVSLRKLQNAIYTQPLRTNGAITSKFTIRWRFFKLYLHISNRVPLEFTSTICCLRQMRTQKSSGGKRHCYSHIAHTHRSLLAVSQIRGVAPRIKIHHSSHTAWCSRSLRKNEAAPITMYLHRK
jgi:hypothetical protein